MVCDRLWLPKVVHTDSFASGKSKSIVSDTIQYTVNTKLLASLSMWEGFEEGFKHTHKAESSSNNEASEPFQTDFRTVFTLRLKRARDKMLPRGNTDHLLKHIRKSGPSSHLKQLMGQKPTNKGRQMAMKIKVIKIRQ